jgi:predicted O-methyltransferase YrrM
MGMTPERWTAIGAYLDDVFGEQSERMATLMPRAVAAGLPDIAVSASVGHFLHVLCRAVGARTIVEVGTLGGYSGAWLARGLEPGGRLITIEPETLHADFAQGEFEAMGLADRVEIRRGFGMDILPKLVSELGEGGVDVVFLDAIKSEYPEYLPHAKAMLRCGGLLIADNALGGGSWWINDPEGSCESRDGPVQPAGRRGCRF